MNKKEHLLTILAEECAEVIHEVTKSLRFGLDDQWKENAINSEKLTQEMSELVAVYNLLIFEGYVKPIDQDAVAGKYAKVEHFLNYSRERGTLNG